MKTPLPFSFRPFGFAGLCVGLAVAGAAFGQTVTPPAPKTKADPAQQAAAAAAYRSAVGNARTLAKANNFASAEQTLTAMNRATPSTAAWHAESARRLIQLGADLARDGRKDAASALSTSALTHLNSAYEKATTPAAKASALAFSGYIHERYRGDLATALARYQAAAVHAPKDAAIKENVARLLATEASLRAKGRVAGK
jgi:hypothetical protein